jgi:hypothetical protein
MAYSHRTTSAMVTTSASRPESEPTADALLMAGRKPGPLDTKMSPIGERLVDTE